MQDLEPRPLFAYGSLMTDLFNYQLHLIGKVAGPSQKARIKGSLYHLSMKGYPALLSGEDWVYGEVFRLKDFSDTLKELDELEGYHGPQDVRNEYERQLTTVELYNPETRLYDRKEKCYCYFYRVDNDVEFPEKSIYLPEGDWRIQA